MHTKILLETLNETLGRPRRRWENNIKIHFKQMGREGVDQVHLYQVRDQWKALVNTVMNLLVA
jgi:hypothetical protein